MKRPIIFVAALLWSSITLLANENDESWLTRSGYYRVSIESRLQPLVINTIHEWVVHVETPAGEPVHEAQVSITGGMPAHNHGLPTSPAMIAELGNGDYLLAGMRFHMRGYWELLVTVDAGGRRDTVVIPLEL